MNIKTTLIAALITLSTGIAHAGVSDSLCLTYGKLAEQMSTLKDRGMTEKEIVDRRLQFASDVTYIRQAGSITSYVYTMSFDAATIRQMVYLKCKVGDFD